MSPDVAFIGLGAMGGAMARRLLATGASVRVFDLDPERRAELVEAGGLPAESARETVKGARTTIICLPTSRHVEETLFGPEGIAAVLTPGSLVIDATSGDAVATRALADRLAARSISLVDAPVSGGPQGAQAGTLAIMLGGSVADVARASSVLARISPQLRHVGTVGSAHCVKSLNNLLAAGHRLLAFEATSIAASQGVDPQVFTDCVNISSGRSYATEVTLPRHLFGERLDQGFALGLMTKDVGIASSLVPDELGSLSLVVEVRERMERLCAEFGADADVNQVIAAYEAATQVMVATSKRS